MKRRLGRTGFEISEIALGAVEIGMKYGIVAAGDAEQPDYASAEWLLNRALDLGINFIDTARTYGDSESFIGRALSARRNEFILASKVPAFQDQGSGGSILRQRVVASVKKSLRELRTDVIDLMMIHSGTAETIRDGAIASTLSELRDSGWIRTIGITVYGNEAAMLAIASAAYDCVQIAYSVLDRRPEQNVLAAAQEHDIGIISRSVLLKGAISHRIRHMPVALSGIAAAVGKLETLLGREVESLPELAYRYVLSHPVPGTALVGTARVTELEAAIRFADRGPLSESMLSSIRSLPMLDPFLLDPSNWPPV